MLFLHFVRTYIKIKSKLNKVFELIKFFIKQITFLLLYYFLVIILNFIHKTTIIKLI